MADAIGSALGGAASAVEGAGSSILGGLGSIGSSIVGGVENAASGLGSLFGAGGDAAATGAADAGLSPVVGQALSQTPIVDFPSIAPSAVAPLVLNTATPDFSTLLSGSVSPVASAALNAAPAALSTAAPAALSNAAPLLGGGAVSAASEAGALPADAGALAPAQDSVLGGVMTGPNAPPTVQAPAASGGGLLSGVGGALKSAAPLVGVGLLLNTLLNSNKANTSTAATQTALQNETGSQQVAQQLTNTQTGTQNQNALDQQGNQIATQTAIQQAVTPQLLNELQGKLPPAAQAAVDAESNASVAAIKSKYASLGMSGSTAETQDISSAKSAAVSQSFAIAQQLAQEGLAALTTTPAAGSVTQLGGDAGQLLEALLQSETTQSTQLGQALAQFAAASVGTSPPNAKTT